MKKCVCGLRHVDCPSERLVHEREAAERRVLAARLAANAARAATPEDTTKEHHERTA